MQENAGYFRSTTFGGFHRQDVLDHIEAMNRTHREELEQAERARADLAAQLYEAEQARQQIEQNLADQLAEETQARQTAQEQLESITQEARTARREAEEYKAQVEQYKAQAQQAEAGTEDLHAKLTQANQELADIRREREQLRSQVDSLVPGAASWQRIRDTAGEIEVSAHERAQITIQQAQEQAAEIRAKGLRQVREIQAGCETLREQLQASIKAAEAELSTIRTAFTNTGCCVGTVQKALADLLEQTKEIINEDEPESVEAMEAIEAIDGIEGVEAGKES